MKKEPNQKPYKEDKSIKNNMSPGDSSELPDESFIFIDAGFLSKLSKYFGDNHYLRYDLINFSENLCKKQNLSCKQIYYYTAPPFQSNNPSKDEEKRKKNYDKFKKKILQDPRIIIREGRCQRLKINDSFEFNQKAVDTLAIIDLMEVPINNKNIKKIILIACDSDFVPVVKRLEEYGIKTILYTYYQKARDENFSTSNQLIKSVWKYIILTKEDFEDCPLKS